MWARRLGVPHLWPSRVKVFFLGLLTSAVIFSVFQYLHGANVEYLDFEKPVSINIFCKLPREECRSAPDPVRCTVLLEDMKFWRGLNLSSPCPTLPASLKEQTCLNPNLPLTSISGDLSSLRTVNSGVNPFKLWSILFLILTSLLSFSIVIHDMALLEESLRPRILSLPNMRYEAPRLWEWLFCVQCLRRLRNLRRRNRVLWTMVLPVWNVCWAVSFMVVLYPLSLLSCFVAPVQMSRIMVFLSGILCMMWSIIFVIETALDTQPYAVLWDVRGEPKLGDACVCWCEFPLSRSVVLRVVVLSVGVCWNSFNLTFRALRGLRRAQWANMFSVLYAVPIEAFPVFWERPKETGGGPVKWRENGHVQTEPAFDPFCLMDEQPESGRTRVQIMPVKWTEEQQFLWDGHSSNMDTEIGCCGFPRPLRAAEDGMYDDDDDQEVGTSPNGPRPDIIGQTNSSDTAESSAHRARDHRPASKPASKPPSKTPRSRTKGTYLQVERDSLTADRGDPSMSPVSPVSELGNGLDMTAMPSNASNGGDVLGLERAEVREVRVVEPAEPAAGTEASEVAEGLAADGWRQTASPSAAEVDPEADAGGEDESVAGGPEPQAPGVQIEDAGD
mmetsp:Transcript_43872/g.113302  ORF Transcript_43872/g.113302 Transcript_43872/m.113302 type:complete len:615 (-) Transcript_43872:61-1905(-)